MFFAAQQTIRSGKIDSTYLYINHIRQTIKIYYSLNKLLESLHSFFASKKQEFLLLCFMNNIAKHALI